MLIPLLAVVLLQLLPVVLQVVVVLLHNPLLHTRIHRVRQLLLRRLPQLQLLVVEEHFVVLLLLDPVGLMPHLIRHCFCSVRRCQEEGSLNLLISSPHFYKNKIISSSLLGFA